MNLFDTAKACLDVCDVEQKLSLTEQAAADWLAGKLKLASESPVAAIGEAGHPHQPVLVAPRELPKRSPFTDKGRAALIHALTHIEFNAINLAWDAVYRFRDMPKDFYGDWIRVAKEEACHFGLLRGHLRKLGHDYGDFPAHNGLWEMAIKTADDPLSRMALVPRVLEARGLDVTPAMMQGLHKAGDLAAVEILRIILRDETGHVEIGTRWFRHCCRQRKLDADATFRDLIKRHMHGSIHGPFHTRARRAAGFSDDEMEYLESL